MQPYVYDRPEHILRTLLRLETPYNVRYYVSRHHVNVKIKRKAEQCLSKVERWWDVAI